MRCSPILASFFCSMTKSVNEQKYSSSFSSFANKISQYYINCLGYIPYNSSNKERAKENRAPMTKAERKMWFWILQERPWWYKFIRQKMIDSFILDFYCSKLLLGIEIDWPSHNNRKKYDAKRTERLWKRWIKIIRYTNEDVFCRLACVSQDLAEELKTRVDELV